MRLVRVPLAQLSNVPSALQDAVRSNSAPHAQPGQGSQGFLAVERGSWEGRVHV